MCTLLGRALTHSNGIGGLLPTALMCGLVCVLFWLAHVVDQQVMVLASVCTENTMFVMHAPLLVGCQWHWLSAVQCGPSHLESIVDNSR